MESAAMVLEYLKVFLSGPVVGGVLAVFVLIKFHAAIERLIDRIKTVKFPGGEFGTSQVARDREESKTRGDKPASSPIPAAVAKKLTEALQNSDVPKPLLDQLAAERARAALWEYRYLNYFLARSSQWVLDWFATLTEPTSLSMFDSFWLPIIPSQQERQAVINVLDAHRLIMRTGEMIEVSAKGREYLQWRGPLPALPQIPISALIQ